MSPEEQQVDSVENSNDIILEHLRFRLAHLLFAHHRNRFIITSIAHGVETVRLSRWYRNVRSDAVALYLIHCFLLTAPFASQG